MNTYIWFILFISPYLLIPFHSIPIINYIHSTPHNTTLRNTLDWIYNYHILPSFYLLRLNQLSSMKEFNHGTYELLDSEKKVMEITTKVKFCVVHFFHGDFRTCEIMHMHLNVIYIYIYWIYIYHIISYFTLTTLTLIRL